MLASPELPPLQVTSVTESDLVISFGSTIVMMLLATQPLTSKTLTE